MHEELDSINERTHDLIKQAFSNHPQSFDMVQIIYHEELSANKIKLEMLFSETDVKEQSNHTSQFAQATRECSGQNGSSRVATSRNHSLRYVRESRIVTDNASFCHELHMNPRVTKLISFTRLCLEVNSSRSYISPIVIYIYNTIIFRLPSRMNKLIRYVGCSILRKFCQRGDLMILKDMLTWDCTLIPIIQIFFIGMGTSARIIPEESA